MFNKQDNTRNEFMLTGSFAKKGYDWWWHSFTAQDADTGAEKPFFIEFFIINPALSDDVPTLGQNPANKQSGKLPSYLMVKAGCWGEDSCQLHRFFSFKKEVRMHPKAPYSIQAADCLASETEIKGSISVSAEQAALPEYMCDTGSIQFELTMEKQIAFNVGYGAGKLFRAAKAFEMYWHAEGMKTLYSGSIVLNGKKYIVRPETSCGYADKNWGRNFTSPWVWLSSCNLKSRISGKQLENSVFDIGGGRPKVLFVPLERKLLGAFYYEGREFEFNFSKLLTAPKTEFSCQETDDRIIWHVRQENRHNVMITDVTCLKKHMLLINYEAPDGTKRHNRLWNGGNGTGRIRLYKKSRKSLELIDDINAYNIGCEYGEYDR